MVEFELISVVVDTNHNNISIDKFTKVKVSHGLFSTVFLSEKPVFEEESDMSYHRILFVIADFTLLVFLFYIHFIRKSETHLTVKNINFAF